MFKLILVCTIVAAAVADVSHLVRKERLSTFGRHTPPYQPIPVSYGPQVRILRQNQDIHPDGSYSWAYDTENGISANEQAQVRAIGPELSEKSAQGAFSWTSPEGEHVSVQYVADGNGYQPQGSHIPVAPPVPEAIQRALAYIAAHPQRAEPTTYRRF